MLNCSPVNNVDESGALGEIALQHNRTVYCQHLGKNIHSKVKDILYIKSGIQGGLGCYLNLPPVAVFGLVNV